MQVHYTMEMKWLCKQEMKWLCIVYINCHCCQNDKWEISLRQSSPALFTKLIFLLKNGLHMIGTTCCAFLNHPQSQIMKIYFKTFQMNKQMKSSMKTYYTFCPIIPTHILVLIALCQQKIGYCCQLQCKRGAITKKNVKVRTFSQQ